MIDYNLDKDKKEFEIESDESFIIGINKLIAFIASGY